MEEDLLPLPLAGVQILAGEAGVRGVEGGGSKSLAGSDGKPRFLRGTAFLQVAKTILGTILHNARRE